MTPLDEDKIVHVSEAFASHPKFFLLLLFTRILLHTVLSSEVAL